MRPGGLSPETLTTCCFNHQEALPVSDPGQDPAFLFGPRPRPSGHHETGRRACRPSRFIPILAWMTRPGMLRPVGADDLPVPTPGLPS